MHRPHWNLLYTHLFGLNLFYLTAAFCLIFFAPDQLNKSTPRLFSFRLIWEQCLCDLNHLEAVKIPYPCQKNPKPPPLNSSVDIMTTPLVDQPSDPGETLVAVLILWKQQQTTTLPVQQWQQHIKPLGTAPLLRDSANIFPHPTASWIWPQIGMTRTCLASPHWTLPAHAALMHCRPPPCPATLCYPPPTQDDFPPLNNNNVTPE